MTEDWGGRLSALSRNLLGEDLLRSEWRQLRTASVLDAIRPDDAELPAFTFSRSQLAQHAYLIRLAEIQKSRRERRANPRALVALANAFGDLASGEADEAVGLAWRAQSATMWSLAGYQANAIVLARRLDASSDADALEAAQTLVRLVGLLVLRDLPRLRFLANRVLAAIPAMADSLLQEEREADPDFEDVGEGPEAPISKLLMEASLLAGLGQAAQAALAAADYWTAGNPDARDTATERLASAASTMQNAGLVDSWMLCDSLTHVVKDSFEVSLWRLLPGNVQSFNGQWRRLLRRLAVTQSVTELWPSQLRAIQDGLLDGDVRVLASRMPTSAGKTRMTELAIMNALAGTPDRDLAVFVVPSRALAGEVETNLAQTLSPTGLRVSALFGGYDSIDFEQELLANTDVLVVTAEKLDLLLRQDESIAPRLAIVVVDEGHLVGEGERGMRLELLLTRLRGLAPDARIVLASAVMPNVEDLRDWLARGMPAATTESDWSPSQPLVGLFQWQGQKRPGQNGTVRYEDQEFFVPYLVRRRTLRTRLYPDSKSEIAAEHALHYQRLGPVLIAAATRPTVSGVSKALFGALKRHAREGRQIALVSEAHNEVREELVELATELAGPEHPILDYIARGFAYHTSDVPDALRRALEQAFRDGALKVLVATSTLSQGVNLPARTVIVSHVRRSQSEYLANNEVRNLAGRAGRALVETQGHVVLVTTSDWDAAQIRGRYINKRADEVLSALAELLNDIALRTLAVGLDGLEEDSELGDEAPENRPERLDALDNQLLALVAEGELGALDGAAIEALFGRTLAGVQVARYEVPQAPLTRFLVRRARGVAERVPDSEVRRAFYKTGLSIGGSETALRIADDALTDPELVLDELRFDELRQRLVSETVSIPDVAEDGHDAQAIAALALDWIQGTSIEELRSKHGAAFGVASPMDFSAGLERVVARGLPWGLSSVLGLLTFRLGPDWSPYQELASLPAMAKFGVPTAAAAYASSTGVRSRRAAMTVGSLFDDAGGGGFSAFMSWLSALTPDDVAALSLSERQAEQLGQRIGALAGGPSATVLLAEGRGSVDAELRGLRYGERWTALMQLEVGATLSLVREPENPYDALAVLVVTNEGNELGYVAREVARGVAPLLDEGAISTTQLLEREGLSPAEARATLRIEIALE